MFFSNMSEGKNSYNTMTPERISNLMKLVQDSNTGYLLVSGGGEGFLEPDLMYQIIKETSANVKMEIIEDIDKLGNKLSRVTGLFKRSTIRKEDWLISDL